MDINGQAIKHRTYGSGVITDLTANILTVCFSAGERRFIYPDAFKEYLTMADKKMQQRINDKIAENEAVLKRRRQAEQEEEERKRKILNYTITTNSHAVFDIAPAQAAQVCKTYTVTTGCYLSGYSKGQPRIADRLKPNSACLLTELPSGKPEKERRIIGAFMVMEDCFGEDIHDGIIEGHPQYRMLSGEKTPLLFWNYFNVNIPLRWGSTAFKYCSGEVMNQILSDMTQMLENSEQYESALEFYQYFAKVNRLRP